MGRNYKNKAKIAAPKVVESVNKAMEVKQPEPEHEASNVVESVAESNPNSNEKSTGEIENIVSNASEQTDTTETPLTEEPQSLSVGVPGESLTDKSILLAEIPSENEIDLPSNHLEVKTEDTQSEIKESTAITASAAVEPEPTSTTPPTATASCVDMVEIVVDHNEEDEEGRGESTTASAVRESPVGCFIEKKITATVADTPAAATDSCDLQEGVLKVNTAAAETGTNGNVPLQVEGAEMTQIEQVERVVSGVMDGSLTVRHLLRGALNFILSIPMRIVKFYLWLLVTVLKGCLNIAFLPVQIAVGVVKSVFQLVLSMIVSFLNCRDVASSGNCRAHSISVAVNGHTASATH